MKAKTTTEKASTELPCTSFDSAVPRTEKPSALACAVAATYAHGHVTGVAQGECTSGDWKRLLQAGGLDA